MTSITSNKGSPIRLWQWRLALVALFCAIVWIGLATSGDEIAPPARSRCMVFAQKRDTCHKPVIPGAGWLPVIGARHNVPDSACLSCHQVGLHHADVATGSKPCSSCHVEHIGAMHLASAPVKGCTQCHANLETRGPLSPTAKHIDSFTR